MEHRSAGKKAVGKALMNQEKTDLIAGILLAVG